MPAQPPFLPGASYNTQLPLLQELAFRSWLRQNNVPFNPQAATSDYDMRGFWNALQQGNPMAASSVNPNDSRMHYPDYWKTPLHQSFSNESQWAGSDTPAWVNDSQLASPSGRVVFDEKNPTGGILNSLLSGLIPRQ